MPLDRPPKLAACPDHQRLLWINKGFHAERSADIGRDQAKHVLGHLEHCLSERVTHEIRTLRRRVECRAAACRVVIGNSVAWLHRVDHDAVVDEFERHNTRGVGERGVSRLGVAHVIVPVEDDVAGNVVEKLRRARPDRILALCYRRQRLVFDLYRFGGIARSCQCFGYDQRDWLTNVPHLAERKYRTRRVVPRRAITIDQRDHAGHVAETVGPNVLSGSHKEDTGHAPRRGRVDALDPCVRYRRAQHRGMGHPRQDDVVGVETLPGDETQILMTPHWLTDAEFHAVSSDAWFVAYGIVCIAACHCHSLALGQAIRVRINWEGKPESDRPSPVRTAGSVRVRGSRSQLRVCADFVAKV